MHYVFKGRDILLTTHSSSTIAPITEINIHHQLDVVEASEGIISFAGRPVQTNLQPTSEHVPLKCTVKSVLTLKLLGTITDALRHCKQGNHSTVGWDGDVGAARYELALLPPCPTIRVLSYSNCQR